MIVVSDTSPISNLFIIGELSILRKLYGNIIMPKAVMDELIELEKFGININPIKNAGWITCINVSERNEVNELLADLDLGEAEAIVLAKNIHADWLLIDETKGREIAKNTGLHVIGLLGILLLAKKEGIINEVKYYVEQLISKAKFRIAPDLYERVMILANEKL